VCSHTANPSRTLPNQKTEANIACNVLNKMTGLGMPISVRIKYGASLRGDATQTVLCTNAAQCRTSHPPDGMDMRTYATPTVVAP
jgi:hypothetical protein